MRCGADLLAVGPQLLVQLLARADADERDRDVRLGILAREADHVDRQVEDLHRLAHVEHVDLAAAADRAGLHDERHRLRDGHEVARHLRMGHRDGAALLDLAPEDRDHAARGVEDVAEANGDEARVDVRAVAVGLDDPLAQRLRLAEEVLRVRGLVRRDEHEPLCPVFDRDIRHDSGRERVVADRLERVGLQEGDVLVRSGVEDDARLVALEDLAHLGAVAAVPEHGRDRREVALAHELALDVEERSLRVLDEHEPRRPDARDLTAELGADRAARTGDEDGLAGEVLRDRAHVDLDRLAAEHVLHLNGPDLPREIEIAGDQLVQPRQRLDGNVRSLGDLDHLLACLARSGRDRDQHLVRWVVPQDVRQVVGRAEHADAVQADVLLARVVVDEADRRVAAGGRLEHLAHHELRGIARSDDDHFLAASDERSGAGPLDQAARESAGCRRRTRAGSASRAPRSTAGAGSRGSGGRSRR